jgi:hypothetical protein
LKRLKKIISSEFIRHSYILKSNAIEGKDKETFEKILFQYTFDIGIFLMYNFIEIKYGG